MASELGLISSVRLDGRKDISFVKPASLILYSGLKAHVLSPLKGNNNRCKTNAHTKIHH